ncbi:MAG: hypothetical protein GC192_22520 [Bacteroidetes bacterium]|nr:hypothetical protein [Bacteroidota bacterium]
MHLNPLRHVVAIFLFFSCLSGVFAQNIKAGLSADSLLALAKRAVSQDSFATAHQYLERAMTTASSPVMQANVHVGVGNTYLAERKPVEAAGEFEKGLALLKAQPESQQKQVDVYLLWLKSLMQSRQLEKAETALADAKKLTRSMSDRKGIALGLVSLENTAAIISYYKKDLAGATVHYFDALKISKELNVIDKQPALYDNISLAYFRRGMPDSAKIFLELARATALAQKDTVIMANVTLNLGNYFSQKGQLDSSLHYYQRCAFWSGLSNDEYRVAIANVSEAGILGEMGQPEKALSAYFKALPLLEKYDPNELTRSYGQVAYNYEEIGDFGNSRKYYSKGLETSRANGSETEEAMYLAGLARADWQEGDKAAALAKIAEAKTTKDFSVNQSIQAHVWLTESGFKVAEGKVEQGLQLLFKALAIFEEIDERRMVAATLVEIGKAYQLAGNSVKLGVSNQSVEELLQRGLGMAQQVGTLKGQITAQSALADLYEKSNQPAKAVTTLKQLQGLNHQLFAADKTTIIEDVRTQYETEKKEQENAVLKAKNDLISQQKNRLLIAAAVLGLLLAGLAWLYFQMRQAKAKIAEQATQLGQLNATKDRLFAIISHDLRSEISAFTSLGKIFSFHLGKGNLDRLQDLTTQVNRSASNLSTLLDNLLHWSVSQLEGISLHPQPLDLRQQADEIVQLFEQDAQSKGIVLKNEIAPDLKAMADENSLQLILRNLVSNALKFTPEGGTVRLSAGAGGSQVHINVADTGLGMTPEKAASVFELDRKGSSKGTAGERGTGLGLALCKEFVERNGGIISIDSAEGKGTVCRFTLPVG